MTPAAPRLSLRPGQPGDLPFLQSLAPRLVASAPAWRDRAAMLAEYDELFTAALTDPEPGSAVLVALLDGQSAGFTLLYWHPHDQGVFIKDLAVSADAEGQGVGRFLLTAIEEWGRQQGAQEIMLKTSWFNARAREFYAAVGFREDHVALVLRLDG
ncbi:GNAT superfamily N-acetyltransferase [Deinococcus metalli]|uniref:GNAT superfamily N-acetyltransferase n=1 Tax=Deinococcus metalli TaxID=1141878 RepID=A0A7W8KEM4_9DEIO|nr:GNAT family N-acetyltransferase [Deinococcus metalli]MBB5376736.1 GNAT superfamily N-acetyltransferase [Deinococcus metalli]GHF44960.1 N-acetyltransferase GCN5 [Deinococcus metalli]